MYPTDKRSKNSSEALTLEKMGGKKPAKEREGMASETGEKPGILEAK